MSNWKPIGVVTEGQRIEIEGVNPWEHSWQSLEQPSLELPHPSNPAQRHKMKIYEVESAGRKVIFAAGELSANVWGFYVAA